MLTTEKLAEIRARADAATPGPWGASEDGFEVSAKAAPGDVLDEIIVAEVYHGPENADFLAHARADVPALLDEIDHWRRVARGALDRLGTLTVACQEVVDDMADLPMSQYAAEFWHERAERLRAELGPQAQLQLPVVDR